jgi:hypothetical protein
MALHSRNAQLAFLDEFAQSDCGIRLLGAELADIFEISTPEITLLSDKS